MNPTTRPLAATALLLSLTATCLAPAWSQDAATVLLDSGTPLVISPTKTISSATNKVGDDVTFTVIHDCKINGTILIAKGAMVTATVTRSEHSRMLSKKGVLAVDFHTVKAIDGAPVPVRAELEEKGNAAQSSGAKFTLMVMPYGTGLLFNGADAALTSEEPLTIFVNQDVTFKLSPGQPPVQVPPASTP